jgi:hypothetical protein
LTGIIRVENVKTSASEFAYCLRTASGQLFDVVVGSGHMAALVVRHRAAEMLDDVTRNAHRLDRSAILVDRQFLKDDHATERLG